MLQPHGENQYVIQLEMRRYKHELKQALGAEFSPTVQYFFAKCDNIGEFYIHQAEQRDWADDTLPTTDEILVIGSVELLGDESMFDGGFRKLTLSGKAVTKDLVERVTERLQ